MDDYKAKSSWEDENTYDTRTLQIYALKEFMKSLHYGLFNYEGINQTACFRSSYRMNKGRNKISVQTAIRLYNCQGIAKGIFGKPNIKLGIWSFDDYTLTKAMASRILKSVKLQYCSKTNSILCQDSRVRFIESSYVNLFLYDNKYL